MTKAWAVTMCNYQSFARMADFFGRDMQAHRHDQFFQMHFLDTGQIELQLDDHRYSVQAPLFVLTPPSVPHALLPNRIAMVMF